jgi:hypothetical protein
MDIPRTQSAVRQRYSTEGSHDGSSTRGIHLIGIRTRQKQVGGFGPLNMQQQLLMSSTFLDPGLSVIKKMH